MQTPSYEECLNHLIELSLDKDLKKDGWLDGEGKAISINSFDLAFHVIKDFFKLSAFPWVYPNPDGYLQGEIDLPLLNKILTIEFLPRNFLKLIVIDTHLKGKELSHGVLEYIYTAEGYLESKFYSEVNLGTNFLEDYNRLIDLELKSEDIEKTKKIFASNILQLEEEIDKFVKSEDEKVLSNSYQAILNFDYNYSQFTSNEIKSVYDDLKNLLFNWDFNKGSDNKLALLLQLIAKLGRDDCFDFYFNYINRFALNLDLDYIERVNGNQKKSKLIPLSLIVALSYIRFLKIPEDKKRILVNNIKTIAFSDQVKMLSEKNQSHLLFEAVINIEVLGNIKDDLDFLCGIIEYNQDKEGVVVEAVCCLNILIKNYNFNEDLDFTQHLVDLSMNLMATLFYKIKKSHNIDLNKQLFSQFLMFLSTADPNRFLAYIESHLCLILQLESSYINSRLNFCFDKFDRDKIKKILKAEYSYALENIHDIYNNYDGHYANKCALLFDFILNS